MGSGGDHGQGSRITQLKPDQNPSRFRVLEIWSEDGETLGRLFMLYLKKPVACYYLVYVEVAAPYRNHGLGNRIVEFFRKFLDDKNAIGLLDNIIPRDDPTYSIYAHNGWRTLYELLGAIQVDSGRDYMVYVPPKLAGQALESGLKRLVHHLERRRDAIEMRDNENMVRQTIEEFKDLYCALTTYFQSDLAEGGSPPLMRFMFTRYVTKLIAFRRRISELLGYTGGESLGQLELAPEVAALPIRSYAPAELAGPACIEFDAQGMTDRLPTDFRTQPAMAVENLPNYLRPSYRTWLEKQSRGGKDV